MARGCGFFRSVGGSSRERAWQVLSAVVASNRNRCSPVDRSGRCLHRRGRAERLRPRLYRARVRRLARPIRRAWLPILRQLAPRWLMPESAGSPFPFEPFDALTWRFGFAHSREIAKAHSIIVVIVDLLVALRLGVGLLHVHFEALLFELRGILS